MKKAISLFIGIGLCVVSFAQPKANPNQNDTLVVNTQTVKFIRVGDKVLPVEAFKWQPVFLPQDNWAVVTAIIDKRSYGELPLSFISSLLQLISQQVPQQPQTQK